VNIYKLRIGKLSIFHPAQVIKMTAGEEKIRCPRCGSPELILDPEAGEEVCSRCGLVVREGIVDPGPEWRAFTVEEREARARTGLGSSYTIFDKGLSTAFYEDRDAKGRRLDLDTRLMMSKLRRYDNRSKMDEAWGRNLSIAMAELDRLAARLHIPEGVKEEAALIYRRALKRDLIKGRGRSIDAFVAASLYGACRRQNVPRSLREIADISSRDYSEIARVYRVLIRELRGG